MTRGSTQSDRYAGDSLTRGTIPANVHFEPEQERIAELTAKRDALPMDSTARAIIIETLRRDYAIEP